MPIRNLIFDWSGTLVDDLRPVVEATNAVFVKHGRPPFTLEEFKDKFYLPFPKFYEEHLPGVSLAELEVTFHEVFSRHQHDVPLLDGAREILEFAHQRGMKIFLLSTVRPEYWDRQASPHDVQKYFTHPYTGIIDKRETIHEVLAHHHLRPEETLFVGDMRHDIDTARHGGVMSCALLTGYESLEKLKTSQPDLLFRDLHGLRAWLERSEAAPADRPVATVGALIFNDAGEALFLRTAKWSNLWGIPGGKIDRGESAVAALEREIREETGLAVTEIRFVVVQDCIDSPEFYRPAHFLLFNYTARAASTAVTLNEEADEFVWLAPSEALARLDLNTPTRRLIEQL